MIFGQNKFLFKKFLWSEKLRIKKRKRLNGGRLPPFKMHHGGRVPPFKMHHGGRVPPFKMHRGGRVPPFKMHRGGTVPPLKMHHGGTVPPFKMHRGGIVPPLKMHRGGTSLQKQFRESNNPGMEGKTVPMLKMQMGFPLLEGVQVATVVQTIPCVPRFPTIYIFFAGTVPLNKLFRIVQKPIKVKVRQKVPICQIQSL